MKILRPLLPLLSLAAAEIVAFAVPDSPLHQPAKHPYFAILLIIAVAVYYIAATAQYFKNKNNSTTEKPVFYRGPFLAGVILFLNLLNINRRKKYRQSSKNYNNNVFCFEFSSKEKRTEPDQKMD